MTQWEWEGNETQICFIFVKLFFSHMPQPWPTYHLDTLIDSKFSDVWFHNDQPNDGDNKVGY